MEMEKDPQEDEKNEIYEELVGVKEKRQFDNLSQIEHVEAAKRDAAVAFWKWVGIQGVPLFGWAVAGVFVFICVSLLSVWLFYVLHLLLKFFDFSRINEIKSFLGNVYGFLGGVASTSLLFFLNRKPRQ